MYGFVEFEDEPWKDGGKYSYSSSTYQLVSYDQNISDYPCTESIIDDFNLFSTINMSRSGSYFTDYYYDYDLPYYSKYNLNLVPEVIIPEHFELKSKQII